MLMSLTNSTLRVIYVIPLVHFISCILDGDAACGGQRLEKTALCVPGLWLWACVCCLTSKQTMRLDKSRFAHMTRLLMNPPHHLHHGGQLAVFHNCWLLYCITVSKLILCKLTNWPKTQTVRLEWRSLKFIKSVLCIFFITKEKVKIMWIFRVA